MKKKEERKETLSDSFSVRTYNPIVRLGYFLSLLLDIIIIVIIIILLFFCSAG